MKEVVKKSELETILHKKNVDLLLYFYTPMCGTCKLASQFLSVVENMENVPTIYQFDLNLHRDFAKDWEIESVPCLIYFRNGEVIRRLYAMESVTKIYEFIID